MELSNALTEAFSLEVERAVEARAEEIKQYAMAQLISEASLEEPATLPKIEQPVWYGHIRRRFGWSKWSKLSWARRSFLAILSKAIEDSHQRSITRAADKLSTTCTALKGSGYEPPNASHGTDEEECPRCLRL